jgi:hypothetical protein
MEYRDQVGLKPEMSNCIHLERGFDWDLNLSTEGSMTRTQRATEM